MLWNQKGAKNGAYLFAPMGRSYQQKKPAPGLGAGLQKTPY